jgi:hypothetical protein
LIFIHICLAAYVSFLDATMNGHVRHGPPGHNSGILSQADAAAIAISRIQQKLEAQNQKLQPQNQQVLDRLRHLFQDPVFRQLLRVQVSVTQLKEHNATVQQLRPRDFDIVPDNGALEIQGHMIADEIDEEPPSLP